MNKMTSRFAAFSLLVAAGDSSALAQNIPPGMQALMQACRSDVRSLCSGVFPGGGRIARCLQANMQKASAACQAAVDMSLKQICSDDIVRFCSTTASGTSASACLHAHSSDLSGTCKSFSDKFAVK